MILALFLRVYWSMRAVIVATSTLIIFGSVLRLLCVVFGNITFLIVGNAFYGVTTSALTVCVGQISNKWFADSERTVSSSTMMTGTVFGALLASVFALIFLRGEGEEFKEGFRALFILVNSMGIVLAILAIVFLESAPASPPSKVALAPEQPLPSVCSVFT